MAGDEFNFDGFDSSDDFGSSGDFDSTNSFGLDNGDIDMGMNISDPSSDPNDFDLNQNEDNQFGDLVQPDLEGKRSVKKTAIYAIISGILLIVIVFGAMAIINKVNNKSKDSGNKQSKPETEVQQPSNGQSNQGEIVSNTPIQNQPVPSQAVQNTPQQSQVSQNNGWKEFSNLDGTIVFQDQYLDVKFSVTSVHHYAKVLNNDTIELKTTLTGALSGFAGTFEIDIPFSVGYNINNGDTVDVKVHRGSLNDKQTVIDDIIYVYNN